MKSVKNITAALLTLTFLAAPLAGFAAEAKTEQPAPAKIDKKNYPLKTCVVSDEKLGEMGEPYVFTYQGKDVQLCCKSCRKDFDKNPSKYMKKLTAAEKKTNKKS